MEKQKSPGAQTLQGLIRETQSADAVQAAYLGGPLAFGESDPFPALDLFVVAPREYQVRLVEMAALLPGVAAAVPELDGLRFVAADGLVIHVRVVERMGEFREQRLRLLFSRMEEVDPPSESIGGESLAIRSARFWQELFLAGAEIGRRRPFSAHARLERCRQYLLDLYRLALALGKGEGWYGVEAMPDAGLLQRLTDWLVTPLDLTSQWRCAYRLAATYESLTLPLLERLGQPHPLALRNLVFERLDAVKPGRSPGDEAPVPPPPASEQEAPKGPVRLKVKLRRPAD